jgi:hypothetical protein
MKARLDWLRWSDGSYVAHIARYRVRIRMNGTRWIGMYQREDERGPAWYHIGASAGWRTKLKAKHELVRLIQERKERYDG